MDPMERTLLLFEYIRDFASEEMAQKGYNVESIVEVSTWLEEFVYGVG